MAKVIAPFKIVGTLGDVNFYIAEDKKTNLARQKGKTGVSSEEFKRNPIFTKVKNHAKEFGRCTKKAILFRHLALHFNKRAKNGSFAGRCNKLLLDVLYEDNVNPEGERTFEKGMESEEARQYFVGFEGNILRPLKTVLKSKWYWNPENNEFKINKFNPSRHIDWPEKAEQVHIAIARTSWNFIDNKFTTEYSEEILIEKQEKTANLLLNTKTANENDFNMVYLFIGFSFKDRKRTKELKRSNNTVCIIWAK